MALRLRRGTDAERLLITPLQGEPIFTTDTKRLYVGDGSTVGGVLVTGDQSNTQVSADTTPQLGGDLDLNGNNIIGTGNIAIDGTITATGSINLGDGDEDAIAVGGLINTNLRPAIDGAYDVGTSLRRWNNVWAEGANITGQLTTDSLSVEKIISQDSTVLYEAVSNTVTANFVGTLTGELNGDANGNHLGTFTGIFSGDEGARSVINKLDANAVNITGGTIDNVAIGGGDGVVTIFAEQVDVRDGIYGSLFGDVVGHVQGHVQGNVLGDDSTVLVDGVNHVVTADSARLDEITSKGSTGFSDNTTRLAFNDQSQERITFEGITDGTFNRLSVVPFRAYKGTDLDNKTDTTAGDVLGGFAIDGYRTTGYVNAVNALAAWKSDADFNEGFPGASLTYFIGSNNSTFPTQFIMDGGLGTFTAPVLKSGSYATGDIPTGADVGPGSIVFDSTTNEFKGWNGTSWVVLG